MKQAPDELVRLTAENARLRGDLLTVATRVSHDLRTPIGAILSVADALREMAGDDSDVKALLGSLTVSAEELSKMVKDVSFVLKATANPQPKEPVKMEGVFACALQRLERRIVKTGAAVTQPPAWPQVSGVPAWLEIIWSILLNFALQRGSDSPKIEAGWRDGSQEKFFWLRDGISIPEPQRGQLFQPFDTLHRLDSTGILNFAIMRRLVELQGGQCGCSDDSSIFFTLPN